MSPPVDSVSYYYTTVPRLIGKHVPKTDTHTGSAARVQWLLLVTVVSVVPLVCIIHAKRAKHDLAEPRPMSMVQRKNRPRRPTTEGSKTVRVGWQQLASLINWERFVHLRFRVHTLLQVCPSTWFIPNVPYTSSASGGCMSSKMTLATETNHKPSSPYIHRFWIGHFLQVINMFVTAFKLLSLLIFHLINVFLARKKFSSDQ